MGSVLLFGLLVGLRHALDADHVAGVAALAVRGASLGQTASVGLSWGVGHAVTLLLAGTVAAATAGERLQTLSGLAEIAVGLVLVALGAAVLWRGVRQRIHIHPHRHGDGDVHLHFHSHAAAMTHGEGAHGHDHVRPLMRRAALLGLVHGLAGSGAVVVLAAASAPGTTAAIGFLLVFGLGSTVAMGTLSAAMVVPLQLCARRGPAALNRLTAAVGLATVLGGVVLLAEALPHVLRA